MRNILIKASEPGWEFSSQYPDHIYWMLEQHVCPQCKMTLSEFNKQGNWSADPDYEDFLARGENPYTFSDFMPENYNILPVADRISWLLGTACGAEFYLESTND